MHAPNKHLPASTSRQPSDTMGAWNNRQTSKTVRANDRIQAQTTLTVGRASARPKQTRIQASGASKRGSASLNKRAGNQPKPTRAWEQHKYEKEQNKIKTTKKDCSRAPARPNTYPTTSTQAQPGVVYGSSRAAIRSCSEATYRAESLRYCLNAAEDQRPRICMVASGTPRTQSREAPPMRKLCDPSNPWGTSGKVRPKKMEQASKQL